MIENNRGVINFPSRIQSPRCQRIRWIDIKDRVAVYTMFGNQIEAVPFNKS